MKKILVLLMLSVGLLAAVDTTTHLGIPVKVNASLYVAEGYKQMDIGIYYGVISTSTDGVHWQERYRERDLYLNSIALLAGVYAAVGWEPALTGTTSTAHRGAVRYSMDLINWNRIFTFPFEEGCDNRGLNSTAPRPNVHLEEARVIATDTGNKYVTRCFVTYPTGNCNATYSGYRYYYSKDTCASWSMYWPPNQKSNAAGLADWNKAFASITKVTEKVPVRKITFTGRYDVRGRLIRGNTAVSIYLDSYGKLVKKVTIIK